MRLQYIMEYVKAILDDNNIHHTNSGVSLSINEGNKILSLTTLYYERTSSDWVPYTAPVVTGSLFLNLPPDCIAPIYVRDTVTKKRISPVKISDLSLEDRTWWRTYTTSAEGYKYYSLWNPMRPHNYSSQDYLRFSMIVYPRVKSAALQISMTYAAVPATLYSVLNHSRIPEGFDLILGDYAIFQALMRQSGQVDQAVERLKSFLDGIKRLNEMIKSKYPRGRDYEPQPIEQLIERINPKFLRTKNDRNRPSK